MVRHFIKTLLAISLLLLYAASSHAQQAADLFTQRQYPDALTAWTTEWTAPTAALGVDQAFQLAIALEKTQGWESAQGKALLDLLAKQPKVAPSLPALRPLLAGDAKGAVALATGTGPTALTSVQGGAGVKLLREHGYPLPADLLEAVTPGMTASRITAWGRIPAEQRRPIDDYFYTQYPTGSLNRRPLVDAALQAYLRPPANGGDPERYLDFALQYGADINAITFATVTSLVQQRKPEGALRVAKWLAERSHNNPATYQQAARAVFSADKTAGRQFYQELLTRFAEPFVREVRLDYFELFRYKRLTLPDESLETWQAHADPLCAGDACLVSAQYDAATAHYRTVMDDRQAPLTRRIAAWAGLLDSDPIRALPLTTALVDEITALPATDPQRERMAVAIAMKIAQLADREAPRPLPMRLATRQEHQPLTAVDGWAKTLATEMTRVVDLAPTACLKPPLDSERSFSLRYGATLILLLAGEGWKARMMAQRQLTFTLNPPPGGWSELGGRRPADANKPRSYTSPVLAELTEMTSAMLPAITNYYRRTLPPTAPIPVEPITVDAIAEHANLAKDATTSQEAARHLASVAKLFNEAVQALDPPDTYLSTRERPVPPAPRPVALRSLSNALLDVKVLSERDRVMQDAEPLLKDGLLPALLQVRSPQLLSELTDVTITVLNRYEQLSPDRTKPQAWMRQIAAYLEGRVSWDTKPYATRIREEFVPKANK